MNNEKELHPIFVLITNFVEYINKERIIIYPLPESIDIFLGIDIKELLIKFGSVAFLPIKKSRLILFKIPFTIIKLIIVLIWDIMRK